MKKIINIISVIIGSVIGAGFASGQEIKAFFNNYGNLGLFGIIVSTALISFVIYKVFIMILEKDISTYSQFSNILFRNHKIMNMSIQNIINIFLLISFFIMIIGFASYFEQELHLPSYVGAIVIAVLCYFTFLGNIDRIIKVNELLMPILLLLILFLGVKVLNFDSIEITELGGLRYGNWFISSVLYASYNSILLIPILIGLKKEITDKKQITKVSLITMLCVTIPAIVIYLLLYTTDISNIEIPIIFIARDLGTIYKYLYSFVILAAIFTSAVCAGYSFLKNVFTKKRSYRKAAIVICVIAVFLSKFSFSYLIQIIYPIFGVIGIVQIFLIILEKKRQN